MKVEYDFTKEQQDMLDYWNEQLENIQQEYIHLASCLSLLAIKSDRDLLNEYLTDQRVVIITKIITDMHMKAQLKILIPMDELKKQLKDNM